jgi:hypothetical protein
MSEQGDDNPESVLDPKRLLVDWANKQDAWVRHLVREIMSSRRPLGDDQADELYDAYLVEKGLADGTAPADAPLPYPTDGLAATETLRLVRMAEVSGVNALTPGASIDFSPGLTILYGENGTGKTGYARVLKRLAAVRDAEEIVPNIHSVAKAPTPTARIEYELGGVADSVTWKNELGISPFTRMSIFDSPAVNVRVDENLAYVFIPAEISLFSYVSDGVRSVQERGAAALREATPSTNPFLRYFQRGTPIYQQIEALGAATEVTTLESMASLPANAAEEKERVEREAAALRSNGAEGLLAAHRESIRTLENLVNLVEAVSRFDRERYNEALTVLAALQESYRHVREETFAPGDLPGPADDEWQEFIAAGESYRSHLVASEHSDDGERCIYCRQTLDSEAAALISKYAAFLDDALGRQIVERQRTLANSSSALTNVRLDEVTAEVRRKIESGTSEPVYEAARDLLAEIAGAQVQVTARSRLTIELTDRLAELRDHAAAPLAHHKGEAAALASQLADRATALAKAERDLAGLNSKLELDRHLPEIRTYVESSKAAARLDQLLKRLPVVLRSLTDVSKIASEDLVNNDFQLRFEEECRSLRTPNVRLEFIGRAGKAQRRKTLSGEYRLSQVLSEGEQKVLALADFVAEARMGSTSAPIILDDPVNSLDHRRLQEVSDRIAALASVRQVIVFTHNIWLATELLARFDRRPGDCSYYMVSDDDTTGAKGKVDRANGPRWDTVKEIKKRVDAHLRDAAASSGAAQIALVEASYGEMRSWCEVVVEEVLFGDVARRYRANIMMGGLSKVRPDLLENAIVVIEDLFNRACRYIPDHSQPLPTLSARPSLADAEADWAKAQEVVVGYRK